MEIKEYDGVFFKSFVELIDECFSLKNPEKQELIKWKFFSFIFGHDNKIICAYDKDTIVGQYSNIAHEFIQNGEIVAGYLCQDMCVSLSHRGQGLISKMSAMLYDSIKEKTFTIGFSNKHGVKVDKHSTGYGYTIVDPLTSITTPVIRSCKNVYSFTEIKTPEELDLIDFNKFTFFDDLIRIHKTKEYIAWRFLDRPLNNYRIFLMKDGEEGIGYSVLRFNKGIGVIFDWNMKAQGDKTKLIKTFGNIAKENKAFVLKIQVLYNDFWKDFYSGCLSFKRKEQTYFTLKNHNSFTEMNILDKEEWCIMTGDIL